MSNQQPPDTDITQQWAAMQEQWYAMQETVSHLQRDLEQMHEVLLAQRDEIDRLRGKLAQVDGNVERLMSGESFPTPEEDRPPHY